MKAGGRIAGCLVFVKRCKSSSTPHLVGPQQIVLVWYPRASCRTMHYVLKFCLSLLAVIMVCVTQGAADVARAWPRRRRHRRRHIVDDTSRGRIKGRCGLRRWGRDAFVQPSPAHRCLCRCCRRWWLQRLCSCPRGLQRRRAMPWAAGRGICRRWSLTFRRRRWPC